ncbi:PREDICTED: uncharacterized protein LOC109588600 isoform X2 [Amphimedon queenslandica]|uniref:Uncharacterized protein n=1 Tax=Amphimedon queenslandica TaxID=400682 RepID=A0AAN0JT66_AMPQE|nr:PREDICTED: uncharacterized protein LOC109588600 isoform X2 [Amphimedon queenslandica]|eukprot:XP_019860307.1 PREDICTED: uncharacterized protein LOC109588600 isoform X2 [Amphimedon queenslandica]
MDGPGVFKWITFQEILFLFISCSVLAFLLRSQDSLEFKLVLNVTTEERAARENYANQKFPLRNEKLPLPIVTDLESDGQTDVILVSADKILNVYSRHYTPSYLGHHGIRHSVIVKDVTCCCYDNLFPTTVPVSGSSTQAG